MVVRYSVKVSCLLYTWLIRHLHVAFNTFILLGNLPYRQTRKYIQRLIKPGIKLIDMCETLEETVRTLVEANGLTAGGLVSMDARGFPTLSSNGWKIVFASTKEYVLAFGIQLCIYSLVPILYKGLSTMNAH